MRREASGTDTALVTASLPRRTAILATTLLIVIVASVTGLLALVRWAPDWVGLVMVAGSGAMTVVFILRAFQHNPEAHARLEADAREHPQWREVIDDVEQMRVALAVPGVIRVMPVKDVSPGDPYAAVLRYSRMYAVLMVDNDFLNLDREHRVAVLAHELGHLQQDRPKYGRVVLSRAAFPVAVLVTMLVPFGFAAAVLTGTGTWLGMKMLIAWLSRREEYRADKVAYEYAGEKFADALTAVVTASGGERVPDLWWRFENTWLTHPTLPNRLTAMRRHPAGTRLVPVDGQPE